MSFVLVTTHVGAESTVRKLVPSLARGWKPAFARPGVITFKVDGPIRGDLPRPHPLARCWGIGLGSATDPEGVRAALGNLPTAPHLHVLPGEAGPPGHVPPPVIAAWNAAANEVADRLRSALGDRVRPPARPSPGELVLEVIVRPEEPWILAWHAHGGGRGPEPGGHWALREPEDAPSRNWLKLEEMLRFRDLKLGRGDTVLEIGCAPGGATLAMLDRGAAVFGVDPHPMRLPPRAAKLPFLHHRALIQTVPQDALPDQLTWIVLEASVATPGFVRGLHHMLPRWRRGLKGLLMVWKLNQWDLAERLPDLARQVQGLGFQRVDVANLPSYRQEVAAVATP